MMSPAPTLVGPNRLGETKMIIDRAVHFALGYLVAFGGTILLVPAVVHFANVIGIG
jgi:hypothetical protein